MTPPVPGSFFLIYPKIKTAMMLYKKTLSTSLFCLLSFNAFASIESDYQAGIQHYKNKQYTKAIQSFNAARKQGLKSPALYRNLALSYYMTENYSMATRYFKMQKRYPSASISAEYSLGLVALAQNDKQRALQHFKIVSNSKNKKLQALAEMRIKQLSKKPDKKWNAYAQLEYGHDDNVNADPDGIASKTADSFITMLASGAYRLTGSRKNSLALKASVYQFDYDTINQYDMQVLSIGIKKSFAPGRWQNSLSAKVKETTLGDADYQRTTQYEARMQRAISSSGDIRLRLRHDDIESLNTAYDYLAGTRQRIRFAYRYYPAQDTLKLYYQYEQNDRQDKDNPPPPQSYSPERHTLYGSYTYAMMSQLDLETSLAYRVSTYPGTTAREDKRLRAKLGLAYQLNTTWELQARYQYSDTDSTNSLYTYQANIYTLSLGASF